MTFSGAAQTKFKHDLFMTTMQQEMGKRRFFIKGSRGHMIEMLKGANGRFSWHEGLTRTCAMSNKV
jgi:hypothetical protein